jgi:hypothetical protein
MTIELTIAMYKIAGNELRRAILDIENLKPNLLHVVQQRMDEHDAEMASKYVANNAAQPNLEQVNETQEWSEHSPKGGNAKKKSSGKLPTVEEEKKK